jgi:hypothetical protein
VDKDHVDRWLVAYVEAWKTYDRAQIAALFAEDVSYRYHPYDEPVRGRDAVADAWLGEGNDPDPAARDRPGTYDASYRAIAIDGDIAVAVGTSSYSATPGAAPDGVFHNCFVMRFDAGGRCREFTEWYIRQPDSEAAPAT